MIKTAICEDEPGTRACLASLVRAQPYPCEIEEYDSAEAYLEEGRAADLILLDIGLREHGLDGMALARKLREQAARTVIIFVTGYERYVFDAFDVGAFHYLLKPVDEEKFTQVFSRAAAQIEAAQEKPPRALTFRSANATRTIPLDSIRYIESGGHRVVLHLTDGAFTCYAKLGDLEQELQGSFFRIHKGYLVNLRYVAGYSKTEAALTSGEKLLLSKYKYQEFVKTYHRFLKGGGGR